MLRIVILGMSLAIFSFARDDQLKAVEAELNDAYIQSVTNARRARTPQEVENIKDSESKVASIQKRRMQGREWR